MAADGSAEADDAHVHILAEAADKSHEPQVFRMHRDKKLKALARAYVVFRKLKPGDEANFSMSSSECGDLDPAATAGSYAFCNGVKVVFTEREPQAVPTGQGRSTAGVAQHEEPRQQCRVTEKGRKGQSTGRFQRLASVAAGKKAKATAKAKVKKATVKSKAAAKQQPKVSRNSLPENMSAKPEAPASLCKSTTVQSGPAKGWSVTAWLKGFKSERARNHDRVICWRISSPGRSRTFDTFTSSRGTPNLRDAVEEKVFTQITTAVKPDLTKRIREKRSDLEEQASASHAGDDAKGSTPQKAERVTPQKANRQDGALSGTKRAKADKAIPTPSRSTKPANRPMVAEASASIEMPTTKRAKVWDSSCFARLRRQPNCTPSAQMQPQIVYLKDYMIIGRAETCDLVIDSSLAPQMISRCHALMQREDDNFALTDQGSLNGMLVNGERVRGKKILAQGDEITFGSVSAQPELDYVFELRSAS